MKKLLLIGFVFAQIIAVAQKKDKIDYYTDSDVHRSRLSAQVGYMPYFTSRRLLNPSIQPSAGFIVLNDEVNGKFGQAYGGDLLFSINDNFQFGVGVYNSYGHYQWDAVEFLDKVNGSGDSLNGDFKMDVRFNYINVPIQFGFVTQVADQWYLQVFPALELNFLQQLERDYQITDPDLRPTNSDNFGDVTDKGTQFNLSVNFGLGAEYRFVDKVGLFTRVNFRYMFYELEEQVQPSEVAYTIGGHIGFRFYF